MNNSDSSSSEPALKKPKVEPHGGDATTRSLVITPGSPPLASFTGYKTDPEAGNCIFHRPWMYLKNPILSVPRPDLAVRCELSKEAVAEHARVIFSHWKEPEPPANERQLELLAKQLHGRHAVYLELFGFPSSKTATLYSQNNNNTVVLYAHSILFFTRSASRQLVSRIERANQAVRPECTLPMIEMFFDDLNQFKAFWKLLYCYHTPFRPHSFLEALTVLKFGDYYDCKLLISAASDVIRAQLLEPREEHVLAQHQSPDDNMLTLVQSLERYYRQSISLLNGGGGSSGDSYYSFPVTKPCPNHTAPSAAQRPLYLEGGVVRHQRGDETFGYAQTIATCFRRAGLLLMCSIQLLISPTASHGDVEGFQSACKWNVPRSELGDDTVLFLMFLYLRVSACSDCQRSAFWVRMPRAEQMLSLLIYFMGTRFSCVAPAPWVSWVKAPEVFHTCLLSFSVTNASFTNDEWIRTSEALLRFHERADPGLKNTIMSLLVAISRARIFHSSTK
jgi:hypothetical protein